MSSRHRPAAAFALVALVFVLATSCGRSGGQIATAVVGGMFHGIFAGNRWGGGGGSYDRCDDVKETAPPRNARVARYEACMGDCEIDQYACMPHGTGLDVSLVAAKKTTCDAARARCEDRCALATGAPDDGTFPRGGAPIDGRCTTCLSSCRCPGVSLESVMTCVCDCRRIVLRDEKLGEGCPADDHELQACMDDFRAAQE